MKAYRNLLKIMRRLGVADQAKARPVLGTCNLPATETPNLYFGKIKLPNYPISNFWQKRYNLKVEVNVVNERANKYLHYQFMRLWRSRNNPRLFFAIGKSLIWRSKAFRVSFLNKTMKGWYQNEKLEKVLAILKRVPTLRHKTKVHLTRFYVPKSNGKLRPVGSPRKDWKIILSMWAWVMSVYVSDKFKDNQHAFIPGKGLWTAWLELLTHVKDHRMIWEYDLEKFFNSIRLYREDPMDGGSPHYRFNFNRKNSLEQIMKQQYKIPTDVVDYILRLNTSTPTFNRLEDVDKLDPELWHRFNSPREQEGLLYWRGKDSPLRPNRPRSNEEYGLAQGSPLSPILAIMVLNKWKSLSSTTNKILMYADDGFFYSNNPDDLVPNADWWLDRDEIGVKFNEKKTGLVKYKGKWLKTLEFVGSIYDPWKDTLNGVPIDQVTHENLFKIVGQSYGRRLPPEEWDW